MISPIAARLRRRSLLLLSGIFVFIIVFVVSRRIDISIVGELVTDSFSRNSSASFNESGQSANVSDQQPQQEEQADKYNGAQIPLLPMSYGTSRRPKFNDLKNVIGDMSPEYIPGPGKRLIFIGDVHGQLTALKALLRKVGFNKAKGDHLILTGDLVNKGPDSAGVVQLAMDLGASTVRGNHEDRVILAHAAAKASQSASAVLAAAAANAATATTGVPSDWDPTATYVGSDTVTTGVPYDWDPTATYVGPDTVTTGVPFRRMARGGDKVEILDNLEQEPFDRGDRPDRETAAKLSPAQLSWLESLPVILRIGRIPSATSAPWNAGSVLVAHAGLVPGLALDAQDPWETMNMRTLVRPAEQVLRDQVRKRLSDEADRRSQDRPTDEQVDDEMDRERAAGRPTEAERAVVVPVDSRSGEEWDEEWDRRQNAAGSPEERAVVVFGHDAKRGLRVGPRSGGDRYAFGLDSGCVYGRQLSALVLEALPEGGVAHSVVHVNCQAAAAIKED